MLSLDGEVSMWMRIVNAGKNGTLTRAELREEIDSYKKTFGVEQYALAKWLEIRYDADDWFAPFDKK